MASRYCFCFYLVCSIQILELVLTFISREIIYDASKGNNF